MGLRSGKSLLGIVVVAGLALLAGCAGVASRGNLSQALQTGAPPPNPLNVPVDQYGGRMDVTCAQATGWFHAEKLNNRWWLCTPDGHGSFFQAIGAWTTPIIPKYNNDGCTAAAALIKEFGSWGFNGVGELSDSHPQPIGTCPSNTKWPEIQTINVSNYAAVNLWNYAQRPMKNLLWGLNNNYTGWRASVLDFFEPQYGIWLDGYFTHDAGFLRFKANPYFAGVMLDDTDWFWGMGAGPDFHTIPEGHTNAHVGYMVLITSPVQVFNPNPASRNIAELYTDTKIYSKTAMASPPATCSVQTPCSLRDYLSKKYNGNIAALNAAWGSNYTTFDSTGTQVSGEVIGTGDGSTKVFTHTAAHFPMSPDSVVIKVAGLTQGADCPWFQSCNVNSQGSLTGPPTSTIAVGQQAWLASINGTANNNFPALSMWAVITYHFPIGSGQFGTPSREVGENFLQGHTQGFVQSPIDGTGGVATGYDVYVSCRLDSSTTPALGCVGSTSSQPAETLQASNIPFGTNWAMPVSGLVSGAAIPGVPSTINYTNGQLNITFSTAPTSGQQITADYIFNGWMYGTGLMDEDGRNSWVGTNAYCLSPALSCDGHDNPRPNANANLAVDLDAWAAQFSAQYFGTLSTHLKAAAPHMLYLGADTVGTWGVPPRKEILAGASPFIDGVFTSWLPNQPDATTGAQMYQYLSHYVGDKPLINTALLTAEPDSAMAAYPVGNAYPTQQARGQQWNTTVTSMLNQRSYNNTYQWMGIVWWGSHDFNGGNGEFNDWGLKTPSDNAYDGHEAVVAIVPCSPPLQNLQCGGEAGNYGDAVTPIRIANQLWLTVQ